MRVLTTRGALLPALTLASKSVDKRNSIPILGCALLSVNDNSELRVTGTDMELASVMTLDVASDETGSVALQLKPLIAYVKALDKMSDVLIEATEGGEDAVRVTSGERTASFVRSPVDDFPSVSEAAYTMSFVLDASVLARMIATVKPAISTEETRYYLNGIHIGVSEGNLRFLATDGHRLMLARMPLPEGVEPTWQGVILPRIALCPIAELLGKKPCGEVSVSISDTRLRIKHGQSEVVTKLIDGTFPDIDRVIPRNNGNVLIVDAAECAATAKALDQLDDLVSTPVKFSLSADGCTMSFRDVENGASAVKLNGITHYVGDDMEIGFQARYVRELLGVVSGEVEIRLDVPTTPATMTAASEPGWQAVLMPVRC